MRLRHDKRTTRPSILPTVEKKKREKTRRESERSKEGFRDKI
jgi:hypothetical protein